MSTALTSSPTAGDSQTVRLAKIGPDASGRTSGEAVRVSISLEASEIIFDCEGLESMSPSFADEVFGKLAAQARRPPIRVINATPEVLDAVRFAVQQRTS